MSVKAVRLASTCIIAQHVLFNHHMKLKYLEHVNGLLHPGLTILKQRVELTLAEELLDPVSTLLCNNKGIQFVKSPIDMLLVILLPWPLGLTV